MIAICDARNLNRLSRFVGARRNASQLENGTRTGDASFKHLQGFIPYTEGSDVYGFDLLVRQVAPRTLGTCRRQDVVIPPG